MQAQSRPAIRGKSIISGAAKSRSARDSTAPLRPKKKSRFPGFPRKHGSSSRRVSGEKTTARTCTIFGRRIWTLGINSAAVTSSSGVAAKRPLLPLRRCQKQLRAFLEFHVTLGKHNDTCRFSFRILSNLQSHVGEAAHTDTRSCQPTASLSFGADPPWDRRCRCCSRHSSPLCDRAVWGLASLWRQSMNQKTQRFVRATLGFHAIEHDSDHGFRP